MNHLNAKIISHAKRLMLYNGISHIRDLYHLSRITSHSLESIINTKCGLTVECIEYLFSFQNLFMIIIINNTTICLPFTIQNMHI